MSTPFHVVHRDPTPLRGRDAELAAIVRRLGEATNGQSSVVVVDGRRGSGKTRLLEEAKTIAGREGFGIGCGVAVQGDDAVTMAPLLAALLNGPKPLLDRRCLAPTNLPVDRELAVHGLEAPLEQAARRRPVLISLDDLHWADHATAAALRILPARLSDLPIVWLVAFRASAAFPALTDLTAHLRRGGAEMLSLAPLEDTANAQIVADITGAEPSTELRHLAMSAGGDPSFLVELVRGLMDESMIRLEARRAELVEDRIPQRLGDMTGERLAPLSSMARQAATVASVLGKAVSLDLVAAMLDVPPASLLGPIEELVRADVLVTTDRRIAFHNDLLRRSVIETAPQSVGQALDRQAIEVMVAAGALPIEPAMRLAATAEVGDHASISTLTTASRALASSDPEIAAELSRRALDLSPAGDPRRPTLVAEVALLLHDAGRAYDGKAFADAALLDRLAPEHEAEIQMSVAKMYDLSPELRVGAGSAALALPELPGVLRARHLSGLVLSVLSSGRLDVARQLLPRAETAVAHACDATATRAIESAEMHLAYMEGEFAEAVQRIDGAPRWPPEKRRAPGTRDGPAARRGPARNRRARGRPPRGHAGIRRCPA